MGSSFTTVITFAIWLSFDLIYHCCCAAPVSFVADTFYTTLNSCGEFLASYHVLHGIQKGMVKLHNIPVQQKCFEWRRICENLIQIRCFRDLQYGKHSDFEFNSTKFGIGKVHLVAKYPVLINDWHDSYAMIHSHQVCMIRMSGVQDPLHIIWYFGGIVGFYNHWVGKAISVTFQSWPCWSWRVGNIQGLK